MQNTQRGDRRKEIEKTKTKEMGEKLRRGISNYYNYLSQNSGGLNSLKSHIHPMHVK
jgi:hypothetical protein